MDRALYQVQFSCYMKNSVFLSLRRGCNVLSGHLSGLPDSRQTGASVKKFPTEEIETELCYHQTGISPVKRQSGKRQLDNLLKTSYVFDL